MFDATSRYIALPVAEVTIPDGQGGSREVRFVTRRFVPPAEGMTTLAEHSITRGDRLDNVTAQALGDPTQFWRVCDANVAMNPDDLTSETQIGRTLRIPVPQA